MRFNLIQEIASKKLIHMERLLSNTLSAGRGSGFGANLSKSVDLCSPTPLQRWNVDSHYSPESGTAAGIYARLGCHLDEIDSFDSHFFRLPKSEAMLLDPHARLLLQTAQARICTAAFTSQSIALQNSSKRSPGLHH